MASQLGSRLRRARTEAGLKVRDVADHVQRAPQTVYRWEWGATEPSLRELRALSELYGVSFAWLATGAGPFLCEPARAVASS
jgi:transcriptional regulator with XRE-family HTH domain